MLFFRPALVGFVMAAGAHGGCPLRCSTETEHDPLDPHHGQNVFPQIHMLELNCKEWLYWKVGPPAGVEPAMRVSSPQEKDWWPYRRLEGTDACSFLHLWPLHLMRAQIPAGKPRPGLHFDFPAPRTLNHDFDDRLFRLGCFGSSWRGLDPPPRTLTSHPSAHSGQARSQEPQWRLQCLPILTRP